LPHDGLNFTIWDPDRPVEPPISSVASAIGR
jgi:hypothetical protein